MSWKHTFISNTTISLLKFANRLSCAFKNCAFTEWCFTILAAGFRNIPEYSCCRQHCNNYFLKRRIHCYVATFFLTLSWLFDITISATVCHHMSVFIIPFTSRAQKCWHCFLQRGPFLKESRIGEIRFNLSKWFNITTYLLLSIVLILEALALLTQLMYKVSMMTIQNVIVNML